ncbi:unnamed protein product [Cylicocyclus nassatus]|uniref:Metalloendopeptidase n=1 Tax=Cylicocyclus nassatus TaxID=53992 RepID=A0AA36GP90_CYLNA|nr:unnamed protein product [Cylicocyclus nassatus]
MSGLKVLLILLSFEYLHLVSPERGPPFDLSQQEGGDVRDQETETGGDVRDQETESGGDVGDQETERTRIHGMYESHQKDYRLWKQREGPSYIIPYMITGIYNQGELKNITDAMQRIQSNTCIVFRKRGSEYPYLKIQNTPDGCVTHVRASPMLLNLQADKQGTCLNVETVLHELLHVVGLSHEHQRPDRDEYITINYENIKNGSKSQFDKLPNMVAFGTYKYTSIMHYGPTAFGRDKTSITIKTNDARYQEVIGKAKDAILEDYIKVCTIYGCVCHGIPY